MKRYLIEAVLCLATVLLLIGCGRGPTPTRLDDNNVDHAFIKVSQLRVDEDGVLVVPKDTIIVPPDGRSFNERYRAFNKQYVYVDLRESSQKGARIYPNGCIIDTKALPKVKGSVTKLLEAKMKYNDSTWIPWYRGKIEK